MTDYLDFAPSVTERSQIKAFVESDAGLQATEAKLYGVFAAWWQLHAPGLGELPKMKKAREAQTPETRTDTKSGLTTPFIKPDNLQESDRKNGIDSNLVDKQE